jgi:hypothetical protein
VISGTIRLLYHIGESHVASSPLENAEHHYSQAWQPFSGLYDCCQASNRNIFFVGYYWLKALAIRRDIRSMSSAESSVESRRAALISLRERPRIFMHLDGTQ